MPTDRALTGSGFVISLLTGLTSGLAATAAMTLAQELEMRWTGRKPSTSPAEAICHLLGFETQSSPQEQRLATAMHWTYGSLLGLVVPVNAGCPDA